MPSGSIKKTKLILFDIDGTLLSSGGAGEKSLKAAVHELFGVHDDLATIEIAGRTDAGIARRIFAKYGWDLTPANLTVFFSTYLRHLAEHLPRIEGRLLPGVPLLLQTLMARPEIALGLLTGNLVEGARLKLTHYGVWDFFELGAFADDHHDRNQLGKFAVSRAEEKHGATFLPDSIFILGDTPHDIECGRAIGAVTVAIATGNSSIERLASFKPDHLLKDLSDLPAVLSIFGLQ